MSARRSLLEWCLNPINSGAPRGTQRSRALRRPLAKRRALMERLEDRRLLAVTPQLLKDINTNTTESSNATDLVEMGGALYFAATEAPGIRGLWKSDGSDAGTVKVVDLPGTSFNANPIQLTAAGDNLFFVVDDGVNGTELWRSDGTAAGTIRLTDIDPAPGSFSVVQSLTAVDDDLYFVANTAEAGRELWTSDGTAAGTRQVADLLPGSAGSEPGYLFGYGGEVYFAANDGVTGRELWKSDGTATGTQQVADLRPGADSSALSLFTESGGTLYFTASTGAERRVWKLSNGTPEIVSTQIAWPNALVDVEGTLFVLNDFELWKTDGTELGTEFVATILVDNAYTEDSSYDAVSFGGLLYFSQVDFDNGRTLWKSDGTAAGTELVAALPGTLDVPQYSLQPTVANGTLFLSVDAGYEQLQLWKTDGTAEGTGRVAVIDTVFDADEPQYMTEFNGALFFSSGDYSVAGRELWKSDGTAAGTVMVKDINTASSGSRVGSFTASGGATYFSAEDGEGFALWRSDGTPQSTIRLTETSGGAPLHLTDVDGTLYFVPYDPAYGRELWLTDGTVAGTRLVTDLVPGPGSANISELLSVNGTLYFVGLTAAGTAGLWKTDGTAAGTVLISDPSRAVANLTDVDGTLFFASHDSEFGWELWSSDGTPTGTTRVADVRPGSAGSNPDELYAIGGQLYFVADDGVHGRELWASDGTEAGTRMVADINPNGSVGSHPQHLINMDGTLFFTAIDGVHDRELWKSDGTAAGTQLVAAIRPGSPYSNSNVGDLTPFNGKLYFRAWDGVSGSELWQSDGTTAGTSQVTDIFPGSASGNPSGIVEVNGSLYFSADDGVHGRELWSSDGTAEGTVLVADIRQGAPGGVSLSGKLANINGVLYLAANDGFSGEEPWILAEPFNRPPVVSGAVTAIATEDDASFQVNLLAGASDPDADTLSVADVTLVSGDGSGFSLLGNTLTVDPAAYNGLADGASAVTQYRYTILDGQGGSIVQTATITMHGANDAPTAKIDQVIVAQGSSGNVLQLIANDVDPDGDTLLIQTVGATARGATVSISSDQRSVLYTPRTSTATGTDSFSYTIVDAAGATSTATVSVNVFANTVVAEPADLQSTIEAQQTAPDEPLDVVVNISPISYSDTIAAINELPPVPEGGQTVFVTLAISDGVYPGAVLTPPPGVVIILNGFDGGITLVGASPALTVASGDVLIDNGVVLTNATDAPTILVTGGALTIRNSTIEESTGFARAAIEVTGGSLDLGTGDSPGGNTLIVRGDGEFIVNTSGNPISDFGNVRLSDTVGNDPPVIAQLHTDYAAPSNASPDGDVTLQGLVRDADLTDSHTVWVNWGDGSAVDSVPVDPLTDAFLAVHSYPHGGIYAVSVWASDGTTVSDTATAEAAVQGVGIVDRTLYVIGTDDRDQVDLKFRQAKDELSIDALFGQHGRSSRSLDRIKRTYTLSSIDRVVAYLLDGNDNFNGGGGGHAALIPQTVFGGSGHDFIRGGRGNDVLLGGDGNDLLLGDHGDDQLDGGDGHDLLFGGLGTDELIGGAGWDLLMGGEADDEDDTDALEAALAQ